MQTVEDRPKRLCKDHFTFAHRHNLDKECHVQRADGRLAHVLAEKRSECDNCIEDSKPVERDSRPKEEI